MAPLVAQNNVGGAEVFLICYLGFIVAMVVFMVVCYCKIAGKAGFSPALGLLVLVPLANIFLIGYLAFAEWPALQGRSRRWSSDYDRYDDEDERR